MNSLVLVITRARAYYKDVQARRRAGKAQKQMESKPSWITIASAAVVDNPWFTRIFMTLILVNTVAMAMEHDGMSQDLQDRLTSLNTYLTFAFAFEVVVKVTFVNPERFTMLRTSVLQCTSSKDGQRKILSLAALFADGWSRVIRFLQRRIQHF